MALDLITIKCPECSGVLSVEAGKKSVNCSYCGSKILIYDDNEYTYHYVDAAEVEHARANQQIREKEIELELRKIDYLEKKRKRIEKVILRFILVAFICVLFGDIAGNLSKNPDSDLYLLAFFGAILLFLAVAIWGLFALVTYILDHKKLQKQ